MGTTLARPSASPYPLTGPLASARPVASLSSPLTLEPPTQLQNIQMRYIQNTKNIKYTKKTLVHYFIAIRAEFLGKPWWMNEWICIIWIFYADINNMWHTIITMMENKLILKYFKCHTIILYNYHFINIKKQGLNTTSSIMTKHIWYKTCVSYKTSLVHLI